MSAQSVRGTARIEGGGQGSAQTTIALVDSLGAIVAGTTTGEAGEYLLRAPHAGTYRVRARRIGFAPDSSSAMVMTSGATVTFDPSMKQLRTQLAEVRVQEARRCVLAPEAGAQALRLWQEAQNALSGAAVNTVSGTNSFVLNRFQRELDSKGKRVIRSTRWQLPAQASETYASISADSLATDGYERITGSDAIYYAPDARTLVSESFAQTHCLRPVAGVAGSDSVGLAFEPVGRDHRTEVAGTLWLARSTGKLKYLEFQYVDPTARGGESDPRAPHATGRVDYRELPNGAWIISSWMIRAPLIRVTAPRTIVGALGSFRTDAVRTVTGWWEFGGDVADVTTAKSDNRLRSFARNSGSLRGTLVDSIVHKGVMGVEVSVHAVNAQGVVARSITDSSGNFGIDSLRAGDYLLAFSAPRLDTLGVHIPITSFAIVPEQELTLVTTMPPSDIERACRSQQPDQRAVHGVVRDGTSGTPLSAVSVRMTWVPRASLRVIGFVAQLSDASTVTDSTGRYVLCGLPVDRALTATMTEAGGSPTKIVIPANADAVILRNVELSAGESNTGSVSGMARARDGSGIAAAEVSLLDDPDKRVYTDSVGAFKLSDVPPGFHLLRIRRLGFVPVLVQMRIAPHGV
ncbi:MAG TPA: carboxypeptidase-like regulatory domain-containing protein, partial [Gemmatimonadaceae bacterium]|nr:carboxypeptidase-like regulatory domain-containing protein [Gemmatimonadaceae bacterium]